MTPSLKIRPNFTTYAVFLCINVFVIALILFVPPPPTSDPVRQAADRQHVITFLGWTMLALDLIIVASIEPNKIWVTPTSLRLYDGIQHRYLGRNVTVDLKKVAFIGIGRLAYIRHQMGEVTSTRATQAAGVAVVAGITGLSGAAGALAGAAAAERYATIWLIVATADGEVYGAKVTPYSQKALTKLVDYLRGAEHKVHVEVSVLGQKIVDNP